MSRAWIGNKRRLGALLVFIVTSPFGLIPFSTLYFLVPKGQQRFKLIVLFSICVLEWVVLWQMLYWSLLPMLIWIFQRWRAK